jgi:CRP-like cAMP-binding protein
MDAARGRSLSMSLSSPLSPPNPTAATAVGTGAVVVGPREQLLRGVPILSALSAIQLRLIDSRLREASFGVGQFLVRAGDMMDELFIVVSGRLNQYYPEDTTSGAAASAGAGGVAPPSPQRTSVMLKSGAVFGQHCVVAQTSLVARYSVVVEEDATVLT